MRSLLLSVLCLAACGGRSVDPSDSDEADADTDADTDTDADADSDADTDTVDCPEPDTGEDTDPPVTVDPDPFMWAGVRYEVDGSQPVGSSMWVGKAAWSDADAVEAELARRVADGEIPYVFFYHWGDGPGRTMGDFQNATADEIAAWEAFALAVAEGIGDGAAYVVIEPEWDSNVTAGGSTKFQDPLRRIIDTFRAEAPNALLVNGPGLWKPDADYAAFAPVAPLFDLHGFLVHVVSNDADCTWRTDGSSFSGGSTLSEALGVVDEIRDDATRVRTLFGGDEVLITDLAITRCGWGDDGQRQIFAAIVDALPSLYDDSGLRGAPIRNGGPSEAERYLGVNNEGMFDYVGHPAEDEVDRAVGVIEAHLDGATTVVDDAAPWEPTLAMGTNLNDWWIEVYASSDVVAVEALIGDAAPVSLPKASWGSFAASHHAPEGTPVVLVARRADGASAGTAPFAFMDEPPVVQPGWLASFAFETADELTVTVHGAVSAELKAGDAPFAAMAAHECPGMFTAAVPSGTWLVRATRDDGAVAYSSAQSSE